MPPSLRVHDSGRRITIVRAVAVLLARRCPLSIFSLDRAAVPVPPACWIALSVLPLLLWGKQMLARKPV
jgi:hypothetical protein